MADHGHPTTTWDTRVRFVENRQSWWWNAWHAPTATERSGDATTREEAHAAMDRALIETGVPKRR